MMSSGTKRKVEELGGYVISAAVGGVVDRGMSAAVGRYEAHTSVDDQLERLRTLAIMVHSAVETAEDVHIRSWWLRRWLWTLRDAALDADEVMRLFRQRREAQETGAAGRQAAGNMVWRALRSVKSMLFSRGNDGGVERLSRMVARLEREAMGLGDFLKMLELEIRRSPPVQRPARAAESGPPPVRRAAQSGPPVQRPPRREYDGPPPVRVPRLSLLESDLFGASAAASEGEEEDETELPSSWQVLESADELSIYGYHIASPDGGDGSTSDHSLSSISHEEYVAGVRKMGLLMVRQRIRRALEWLMSSRKPPALSASSRALLPPDTDRLRELVARIQRAVHAAGGVDLYVKRGWLARWSNQLMTVAGRAESLLLAVPVQAGGGGDGADVTMVAGHDVSDDGLMMRTARDVEMAAAHLEDFVMLAGLRSRLSG